MVKREKRLELRLSQAELSAIDAKAHIAGLRKSDYVRRAALDKVICERTHPDIPYLIGEVRRTGNTLYDMLTLSQLHRQTLPEAQLREALKDNRSVELKIISAFESPWQ